jgi:hypothetical protein
MFVYDHPLALPILKDNGPAEVAHLQLIDRFPQHTLEWLSLPVLADPFWGRSPWLLKRHGGKHSKH